MGGGRGGGAGRTLPDSTLALAGDGWSSVIRGSAGRDDVNAQRRRVTGHVSRVCVDGERGGGGGEKRCHRRAIEFGFHKQAATSASVEIRQCFLWGGIGVEWVSAVTVLHARRRFPRARILAGQEVPSRGACALSSPRKTWRQLRKRRRIPQEPGQQVPSWPSWR